MKLACHTADFHNRHHTKTQPLQYVLYIIKLTLNNAQKSQDTEKHCSNLEIVLIIATARLKWFLQI